MGLFVSLYLVVLVFLLTPSLFIRLPPNGNKWIVAGVHALIVGVIFFLTSKMVWRMTARFEGMEDKKDKKEHK